MKKNVTKLCLELTGIFEAEVLVHLMLMHWGHPLAGDAEFRNDLLENAAELLRAAVDGAPLPVGIPAVHLNFIAAIWWSEQLQLTAEIPETPERPKREAWLRNVQHALPSCFCDPGDLVD